MDTEQYQSNLVSKRYVEMKLIKIEWDLSFQRSADQRRGVGFL